MARLKVLIADDDPGARRYLRAVLQKFDCECIMARDGREALALYQAEEPSLVFADWLMPALDGLELCRTIRVQNRARYTYIILVTVLSGKGSYLEGMTAGADDFVTKPFDIETMAARIRVAQRIIGLQREVRQLEGLLPICSYCRKIRDVSGRWLTLEEYIAERTDVMLSHTFCPDCYRDEVAPQIEQLPGLA